MKRSAYLLSFIVVIIIFLSVVHVGVSNSLSTNGITLNELRNELKTYKKQNALMHEKILEGSSLHRIASAAGSLGLVPGKADVYVTSPLPLARR